MLFIVDLQRYTYLLPKNKTVSLNKLEKNDIWCSLNFGLQEKRNRACQKAQCEDWRNAMCFRVAKLLRQ